MACFILFSTLVIFGLINKHAYLNYAEICYSILHFKICIANYVLLGLDFLQGQTLLYIWTACLGTRVEAALFDLV